MFSGRMAQGKSQQPVKKTITTLINGTSGTTGVDQDSIDQTIINLIHGAFGTTGVGRDDPIEKYN
jgi:hypothetical protein